MTGWANRDQAQAARTVEEIRDWLPGDGNTKPNPGIARNSAARNSKDCQGGASVSTAIVKFYLVGTMRAVDSSGANLLPNGRKTRGLLACLCLACGERVSRNRLAGLLWDRSSEIQAKQSVRHALCELTRDFGKHAPILVEIDRDGARLKMDACWIDALALFKSDANEAGEAAETGEVMRVSADRLLEELDGLTPSFDHFLAAERARLGDRLRQLFEARLDRLIVTDARPELRASAARRLITFEPTHEGAVRALMKAFVELGDRSQAIREYERCRQALRSMLDLAPSAETVALYEAVRRLPSGSRQTSATLPGQISLDRSGFGVPVSGFADPLVPSAKDRAALPLASHAADFQQRASVAVLPLRVITAHPAGEHVAEGIVEDLIEMLSRIPNLFVVSRLSTLAFREQARHPREIGEALGVRYVLSGSFRAAGDHVRLTMELTDTQLGTALWVSKFDETVADIFELQDRISEGVVRRIAPYLHEFELKRIRAKKPDTLKAYDLFLRAVEHMHNSSREVFESSCSLFKAAIAHDPHYAAAYAWCAYWHVLRVGQGWSPAPDYDAREADRYAEKAIECNGMEPMALAIHGHAAAYLHKDFELAFRRFDKALSINPNSAPVWLWSAAAHAWMGDGPVAIEKINRAMALTPYDPLMYAYSGIAGMAYLVDGQYERAIEFGLRCMQENRTYTHAYRLLAIASMLAGREGDARGAVRGLLDLEPGLTVERFRRRYPGSASAHAELFCDALGRAGVPLSEPNTR